MMVLPGAHLMQGNEACAEGAIIAGCRYFAGYPITPATEIAEKMAELMPKVKGIFIQMEDEIASISSVIGASWCGLKSMTATSGPGFSLMQEGIGYAVMTETPCVIVNVQRIGPSQGFATRPMQGDVMQAKWGSHGDYEIIALAPSSVQEMFDLTIRAFNLSEEYRTPVIILSDEVVAHMRENIRIPNLDEISITNRKRPEDAAGEGVLPMPVLGTGHKVAVLGHVRDERGNVVLPFEDVPMVAQRLLERLRYKILSNLDRITRVETEHLEDAKIVLLAYGSPARSALRAVRDARAKAIKAGYVRLVTLWPFPEKWICANLERARTVIVPEMNFGQMAHYVKKSLGSTVKVRSLPRIGEPHSPDELLAEIANSC
jgi:2-oxoglutarate ferredoxin oxidoreductase subunit alpha